MYHDTVFVEGAEILCRGQGHPVSLAGISGAGEGGIGYQVQHSALDLYPGNPWVLAPESLVALQRFDDGLLKPSEVDPILTNSTAYAANVVLVAMAVREGGLACRDRPVEQIDQAIFA